MDALGSAVAVWLVVALLLVGVEVLTLDLIALMIAAGALAAAGTAALGAPLAADILVGAAVALVGLLVLRPIAVRHLRQGPDEVTGTAALVGRQAVVLETVDDSTRGRVKLAGEVWSARAYLPGSALSPGEVAEVMSIEGATAVVHTSQF